MTTTRLIRHGCYHAAEAAQLRYGLNLDEAEFRAMALAIIAAVAGDASDAALASRQGAGREIWIVRVPGGPAVRVVYVPERAQIITVLSRCHDLPPSTRTAREMLFREEARTGR